MILLSALTPTHVISMKVTHRTGYYHRPPSYSHKYSIDQNQETCSVSDPNTVNSTNHDSRGQMKDTMTITDQRNSVNSNQTTDLNTNIASSYEPIQHQ